MSHPTQTTKASQSPYGRPLTDLEPPQSRSEGRTTVHGGYVVEECPNHPRANKWGYHAQHRLVAEHWMGRLLREGEVVHHEDDNKQNNEPVNLWVFRTHADHMRHHKRTSLRYREDLAASLRPMAGCPQTSIRTAALRIGVSELTVRAILDVHQIPWTSAGRKALSEESVREALQGRTTLEAARHLGVNHQTLRNRFPGLLKKRARPGFLDARKAEIRSLATHTRSAEIAEMYGVHHETVKDAIRRWATEEPGEWSEIRAFQRSRRGIEWSKKRRVSSQ